MPVTSASDAELIAASRRGEHAAFGALVERYQDVVCAVGYSRTGDRALSEDVAQDTFLAAWHQLDELSDPAKLRPWLCGIARHLAARARRRTGRETPVTGELLSTAAAADNPFLDACDAESERTVWRALEQVPETYREALVLYYREHQSARMVAHTLAISEAAVLQRLARGRHYLAANVTAMVEHSLGARRGRRRLAAAVLAALPTAGIATRASAATGPFSSGGSMLKLGLFAAAIATASTGAYVAHRTSTASTASAAEPSPAPGIADEPSPIAAIRAAVRPPRLPPAASDDTCIDPEPQSTVVLDRETRHQLGLDRGPSRGPADAPVTIVMFADEMCPFCGNVLGSIDQLWDDYPGKLRLIVKQFPVHHEAALAAEAAYAADAAGKFWGMHELMFANQDALDEDALVGYAARLGLPAPAFRDALDHHTYRAQVEADQAAAAAAKVVATPTFLINGHVMTGAQSMKVMHDAIDAALATGDY